MYYSRLQVYILVARRLNGSSVEVIQFSGSTARWLVSRDYRATEPPQRIYLENLPCILQLSPNPKLLPFCRSRCRRRRCCFKSSLIRQVFLTVHAKLRKSRANYKRPNITSLLSEKKVLANNERCTPRSTCKQCRHRSVAILVHVCLVAAYFFPTL